MLQVRWSTRMAAWGAGNGLGDLSRGCSAATGAVITSLFGVEVLKDARLACPWAVVNSTFYIGPNPPGLSDRTSDPAQSRWFRATPKLLESADMVLHATDKVSTSPSRDAAASPLRGRWASGTAA